MTLFGGRVFTEVVRVRYLVWASSSTPSVLIKRGVLDTVHVEGTCEQEDSHLQAPERCLEQILLSQPLEGTNSANTLLLDVQPPEVRDIVSVV